MDFSADPEIFARLHGMRLAVVVARGESLPETGPGVAETIAGEIDAGPARDFGTAVDSFAVDAATPRIGW